MESWPSTLNDVMQAVVFFLQLEPKRVISCSKCKQMNFTVVNSLWCSVGCGVWSHWSCLKHSFWCFGELCCASGQSQSHPGVMFLPRRQIPERNGTATGLLASIHTWILETVRRETTAQVSYFDRGLISASPAASHHQRPSASKPASVAAKMSLRGATIQMQIPPPLWYLLSSSTRCYPKQREEWKGIEKQQRAHMW